MLARVALALQPRVVILGGLVRAEGDRKDQLRVGEVVVAVDVAHALDAPYAALPLRRGLGELQQDEVHRVAGDAVAQLGVFAGIGVVGGEQLAGVIGGQTIKRGDFPGQRLRPVVELDPAVQAFDLLSGAVRTAGAVNANVRRIRDEVIGVLAVSRENMLAHVEPAAGEPVLKADAVQHRHGAKEAVAPLLVVVVELARLDGRFLSEGDQRRPVGVPRLQLRLNDQQVEIVFRHRDLQPVDTQHGGTVVLLRRYGLRLCRYRLDSGRRRRRHDRRRFVFFRAAGEHQDAEREQRRAETFHGQPSLHLGCLYYTLPQDMGQVTIR